MPSIFYELTPVISLEEAMSHVNQERLLDLRLTRKGVVLFKSRNTCVWTFCVWAIVFFCEKADPIITKLQLIGAEPEILMVNLLDFFSSSGS